MPWHVTEDHSECPSSRPYAVVKDDDGDIANKTCAQCKESKNLDDFPIDRARLDGKYPYCRECHSGRERERNKRPEVKLKKKAAGKAWREANRERSRYLARRSHLRRKYGITPEDWDGMIGRQSNRCAICHGDSPMSKTGWHVDHDHVTNDIRGILCQPCNHVLGYIERGWTFPVPEEIVAYLEGRHALARNS